MKGAKETKMGKKYANPPLVEAVCDFRLAPDCKWDLTIPGLIYEEIKDEFPQKEQRFFQDLKIRPSDKGFQQLVNSEQRVLFLTKDRNIFVQIGDRLMAINCLKPYPTWQEYKPRIESAYGALIKRVNFEKFQRLALRYINRIEIPGEHLESNEFSEYFNFRPFLGKGLPQDIQDFILGCKLPFSDGRDGCKIQMNNIVPDDPKNTALLLDIDYSLIQEDTVSINDVPEWLEEAHKKIETIFEGCITDRLREIFEEIK